MDQFLVSGNFWGFVLEIDADYRRFDHERRVEEENALTFVSTLLKQRKLEGDQMMQVRITSSLKCVVVLNRPDCTAIHSSCIVF